MWVHGAILLITSFVVIHLIAGCIKGVYRYSMIEKYQYDYYDAHPQKLFGRIRHNLVRGVLAASTFYFSFSILGITLLVIYIFTLG